MLARSVKRLLLNGVRELEDRGCVPEPPLGVGQRGCYPEPARPGKRACFPAAPRPRSRLREP